jgi:hypothetical protein
VKQQKLNGYAPNYPKKALRGAVLAAAMLAVGASAGCAEKLPTDPTPGSVPPILEPTPEPMELGYISTMPPDVELRTEGLIPVEEPTPEPEDVTLSGDVLIGDDFQ